MDSLRHLIQTHPIVDNHAHNILSRPAATNYAKYPFEQIISEAHGSALQNALSTLPLLRATNQLADLYGCTADWTAVKAARDQWVQRDYNGLVRRCLQGTQSLLLDDLLSDSDIEPFDWHDQFTGSETKRIVRIETIAEKILATATTLDQLQEQFRQQISQAIADPAVVGFKSVVCYRTGLNVQQHDLSAVAESVSRLQLLQKQQSGSVRVEDKPLNDWLVLQTLDLLKDAKTAAGVNKPLQLHTGLGDADISLVLANPAYLQPVIAQYPEVDFVLLHSSYPYTREAGYLACVYANAYLDLGEVFPMVSRDAQQSIVRESLDLVPSTRLLWSTDGHYFPETFWLGNVQFRQALEAVLVDYVAAGDYTVDQAKSAAAEILFHNSNKLYGLKQTAQFDSPSTTLAVRGTAEAAAAASPIDTLNTFLRNNPDVKFVWMQWVDYTATIRVRMFPIHEFARIVRKQRRVGISLAVFWMLQNDTVLPEGSTTGQFYMEPDLSSLARTVGLDSKSATVMTYWRSEENTELEGCPRSALHNVVSKLESEFDVSLTCGFEIEVVFMKPVTNETTGVVEDYVPVVKNHSWSNMTSDTRRMVPLLEEIYDSLSSLGIHLEQFHAESCPGQFEFILPPGRPVQAVDMLLKARQSIINIVEQHGLRATLYPRPVPGAAGSASHSHVSISPATREESFLAGIMEHYPALMAFTLAQDISYARVKGGLWAGSEWVTWGTQNRETPIRKISPGHWEIKSLDGMANMYLAMAAVIASGYLGLKDNKSLVHKDCAYDAATLNDSQRAALGITTQLPKTLAESLAAIEADPALQGLLGTDLVRNYVLVKRAESNSLGRMDESSRRMWLMEKY